MSLDLTHLTMFRLNFWPKPFFAPTVPGMENSTFVPTPLSSSALMVLASTSEGRDSQRLPAPHPFSGQSMDKDIPHPSFGAGGFVYRPGDPFSPPLYAPMPPFIRPNLERGLGLIGPGGGGASDPWVLLMMQLNHTIQLLLLLKNLNLMISLVLHRTIHQTTMTKITKILTDRGKVYLHPSKKSVHLA